MRDKPTDDTSVPVATPTTPIFRFSRSQKRFNNVELTDTTDLVSGKGKKEEKPAEVGSSTFL